MSAKSLNEKSPIFGLQYIEEEEANLLDVVGCLGTADEEDPTDDGETSLTIRLCGDGFDVSNVDLSV